MCHLGALLRRGGGAPAGPAASWLAKRLAAFRFTRTSKRSQHRCHAAICTGKGVLVCAQVCCVPRMRAVLWWLCGCVCAPRSYLPLSFVTKTCLSVFANMSSRTVVIHRCMQQCMHREGCPGSIRATSTAVTTGVPGQARAACVAIGGRAQHAAGICMPPRRGRRVQPLRAERPFNCKLQAVLISTDCARTRVPA